MRTTYGYVRVSTKEQNEDRQLIALMKMQVPRENIYIDKQSGKDFERPMYKCMLKKLKPNDLVYVKSIDRLGRDYKEILEQWRILTQEKMVDIVVMDMPILDTRMGKDLVGIFLSDVALQIMSFAAENERELIRQRQKEGIEAAKMKGIQLGRPAKPLPENFEQICRRWVSGEISGRKAAKLCGMPVTSFCRKGRKRKEEWNNLHKQKKR